MRSVNPETKVSFSENHLKNNFRWFSENEEVQVPKVSFQKKKPSGFFEKNEEILHFWWWHKITEQPKIVRWNFSKKIPENREIWSFLAPEREKKKHERELVFSYDRDNRTEIIESPTPPRPSNLINFLGNSTVYRYKRLETRLDYDERICYNYIGRIMNYRW